jgi:hypothetical protein
MFSCDLCSGTIITLTGGNFGSKTGVAAMTFNGATMTTTG